jgi:hypothetical protein
LLKGLLPIEADGRRVLKEYVGPGWANSLNESANEERQARKDIEREAIKVDVG